MLVLVALLGLLSGARPTGGRTAGELHTSVGDHDASHSSGAEFATTVVLEPTSGDRTARVRLPDAADLLRGVGGPTLSINGILNSRPAFTVNVPSVFRKLKPSISRFTPVISPIQTGSIVKSISSKLTIDTEKHISTISSFKSTVKSDLTSQLRSQLDSLATLTISTPHVTPMISLTSKPNSTVDSVTPIATPSFLPVVPGAVSKLKSSAISLTPVHPVQSLLFESVLSSAVGGPKPSVVSLSPGIQPPRSGGLIQHVGLGLKPNKLLGLGGSLLQGFLNRVKEIKKNMKIKIDLFKPGNRISEVPNPLGTTELPTEPSTTEPPRTERPMTEPPSTDPSVTEPPMTEPPVTEPPMTDPPITEPPMTDPPMTETPMTELPVTEPPMTEPPMAEPPVTEPPMTEPPMTEAPTTESSITEPPLAEPPSTASPSTEAPPPTPPTPALPPCPSSRRVLVTSTRFSLAAVTEQLHSVHRTESTLYVTESRLTLSTTTVQQTVTKHPLGTLYRVAEVLQLTQYLVRTSTLLRTRYRTVTDHLSVTDTVNQYVTETVAVPRPTTVTVLRTVVRTGHRGGVLYTTVTRRHTVTRKAAHTRTTHEQSTVTVTASRTERVTVTRDVSSTLPPRTVTSTFIYCPSVYRADHQD